MVALGGGAPVHRGLIRAPSQVQGPWASHPTTGTQVPAPVPPRGANDPIKWFDLCTGKGDDQRPGFGGATDLTPRVSLRGPQVTPLLSTFKAELITCPRTPYRAHHHVHLPGA